MPKSLVECIPNYSEARRPEVVNQIIASIESVPGISILDKHSDLDHNRTVVTFIGTPEAVEEAAYRSISKAAQLIDLDQHTGEHPRIGATDVVPFVPISEISMADCVEIARRLGKRVGETLGIPVYLYEEAATRPERQNLENIRHGQYELLKTELGVKPERDPDFGPARISPAGATVIGARQPLIAFNVYLTTDDVSIAQKIARSMRNSNGGWRFVKGMGVLVEGRAQVSMNFTNFRQTPVFRVVESIRREAERYGVGIHHTELVGLVPQDALTDAAVWYLQLDGFKKDQVLESRMDEDKSDSPAPEPDFPQQLAAGTPTPGGGSAAAYAGSMGAALVCMVARLTVGKKKYAAVEEQMQAILAEADGLQREMQDYVRKDAESFDAILTAVRLPKESPEEQTKRDAAIRTATLHAAEIPMDVCRHAVRIMELASQAAEIGNTNAISDAASGLAMARSAVISAGWNVRINLASLGESTEGKALKTELDSLELKANQLDRDLRQIMLDRAGLA